MLVIQHVYIERRMIPLNIYLQEAGPEQMAHAVVEYGNAIKDLVSANIFPGDMLWKNFGVTRHGKVVFYDYDEIEYITDCNFRRVPAAAQRGRGDVGRGLVLGGPARRLPRDLRPLPAGQCRRCARSSWRTTPTCWTPPSGRATRSASSPATCTTSFPTSRPSASRSRPAQ